MEIFSACLRPNKAGAILVGHVTFLGGHVMVPELQKYQIRIPRKILGRNSGLTFVLAQKIKNQFLSRDLFRGSRDAP